MSQDASLDNGREHISAFWPLVLIGATFIVLFGFQLTMVFIQRHNLQAQIEQQKDPVARSIQLQNELQRIVGDLLTLADTDSDAKALVAKYKISRNAPPTQAEPAPAR